METAKQRSIKQNKYRWSVIVKYYQDWLNIAITEHNRIHETQVPMLTDKDANFYIKDKVWGLIERVGTKVGVITVELPLRNAGVSTFEERMEQARAFAAQELHLEIPLPHEDIRDLEEQYADNLSR